MTVRKRRHWWVTEPGDRTHEICIADRVDVIDGIFMFYDGPADDPRKTLVLAFVPARGTQLWYEEQV